MTTQRLLRLPIFLPLVLGLAACPDSSRPDTSAGETDLPAAASASAGTATAAGPPTGRYTCLRLGSIENQIAADLAVLPGGQYSTMDETGTYSFDESTSTMTWTSGPLATATTNWVGVFVPAGQASGEIESAAQPTIRVRDRKDVSEGNLRDLQWCNHVG